MTKTESIIRSIIGPVKLRIGKFALSADVLANVLYVRNLPQDELNLTKHVYPDVMRATGNMQKTVEKSIERVTNQCLDHGLDDTLWKIIGKKLKERPKPLEMLVYIAHYSFLDKPYFNK